MATELSELLDRARRTETRLMRLCTHIGVDVTEGKIRVTVVAKAPVVTLELAGLDVSFSDVLAFCRRSGINGTCMVQCRGKTLGTILVEEVVNEVHS